jgi:putative ABC transport system permease protein
MWRVTLKSIAARRRRLLATCSAVLLGVAFLSATLVLVHTLTTGFADILAKANAGTDALVRSSVQVGGGDFPERGLVDRSLAGTIATVDGVASVAPRIESSGRIVGADGDPVGGERTIAGNWVTDERLNPYRLAEGRAPAAPGEVVIDKAAAEEGHLTIGVESVVRTPEPVHVRIVGLAAFGGADSQGSATYAGFTTQFADQVLLPEPGKASSIAVAAEPGVSQAELVSRIGAVLPHGVEALTGAELTRELEEQIQGDDHETFQQALILFAGVALVVATFSIYNTFSILVAQRTRESALLRTLGASRAQVLRSVAAEALAVGLLASVGGIAAGTGLAWGLLALMDAIGLATPAVSPVLDASTVATALAVGVAVTLLASLVPAVRASRVAPLAALHDVAVDRSATSRRRAVTGVVVTGAGIALTVAGAATGETVEIAGLGALATLTGVVALGPVAARPAAAVLGAPQAAWRGMSGVLARRNAMRNPRRTAATATAMMIGVAVVSLFAVVGASLKQSIDDSVNKQFAGDLVIVGEGAGGLSPGLANAVAELPQVAAASPLGNARVRIDGEDTIATTFDPATIRSVMHLDVRQGSLPDLRPDQVAISAGYAGEHRLVLGDLVTVDYPDGVTERPTVGAIYAGDNLSEGSGIRLPREAFFRHTSRPADVNLLIDLADGVPIEAGEAAVQRVADRFGAPDVQTNQEFTQSIAGEINQLLTVVYVLLVLAIVIALMGIANTLSLSTHERTRELGLLRAVGQTRAQTRAMVRWESVIVALFGTIGGVGLGLFLAWALVSALASDGFTLFAVPKLSLALVLALGALVGVLAAVRPAHRAARMDVLAAIATE